jgi:ERCC4-related helicase
VQVARVCGADNTDNWTKTKWAKLFAENKVIVCTADILHQCLAHSYIRMKQINLLIFDEAHHAKKNHSYARSVLLDRAAECSPHQSSLGDTAEQETDNGFLELSRTSTSTKRTMHALESLA